MSPFAEEVLHPCCEDMPQHPGKVFLLEVLFMNAQLQIKEAFALSLLY